MQLANPTRGRFAFKRDRLPNPADYYRDQGLKLIGAGKWKSAVCCFHADKHPSLRVQLDSGGFRCMACGAHGGHRRSARGVLWQRGMAGVDGPLRLLRHRR